MSFIFKPFDKLKVTIYTKVMLPLKNLDFFGSLVVIIINYSMIVWRYSIKLSS